MGGTLSPSGAAKPHTVVPTGTSRRALISWAPGKVLITQWGRSFQTLRGFHTLGYGIDTRDVRFRSRFVEVSNVWQYSESGDGTLSSQGAPLAVPSRGNSRRALAPRAAANREVPSEGGVSTLAGRYRPGECLFSSPGCWIYRLIEESLIQIWDLIVPWRGETSRLCRGKPLGVVLVPWVPRLRKKHQWGWVFHAWRGRIDLGGPRFRPWIVGGVPVRIYF